MIAYNEIVSDAINLLPNRQVLEIIKYTNMVEHGTDAIFTELSTTRSGPEDLPGTFQDHGRLSAILSTLAINDLQLTNEFAKNFNPDARTVATWNGEINRVAHEIASSWVRPDITLKASLGFVGLHKTFIWPEVTIYEPLETAIRSYKGEVLAPMHGLFR